MGQPRVYNTEEELIKWLKYDLEEQRKEIAKEREILPEEVDKKDLTLNFVYKYIRVDDVILSEMEDYIIEYEVNYIKFIGFKDILENILNYFNIKEKYTKKDEIGYQYLRCPFKVNISHCIFKSSIYFMDILFEEPVNFTTTKFDKDIIFYYIIFKNKVNFSNIQWKNKLLFYEINSNLEFNLSELNIIDTLEIRGFNENIENNFTSIINLDNISFENSKSLLSITNITNKIKYISFKNIIVGGIINIQDVKTEKVNFKGSIVTSGAVNPVEFKIDEFANRESALFLKNEAYAINNIIDALKYKAKEIELHKKELLKNKKDYKKFGDIFSIYLSSLYSDNGLNWIKSIFMTILITFIFFNIFYMPDLAQTNIAPYYYKDYFSSLIKYIPTTTPPGS